MTNPADPPQHTNRLARESSPYLLQHAHNPVDWYPWGPEAFEASRAANKPIFLSVGYSTCYWCHVMERQCFEVEAIADEMNQRFINVKVDREERPDVDQLYMTAVQVLTRHGGWPMSVFLTPDLRPFYGGTYFPPTDMHGRPGFVTVLRGIEDAYRNRPADVEATANQLVNILGQYARPARPQSSIRVDDAFVDDLIRRSISDYDAKRGGFGGAPKFPRETLLELLLVYVAQNAKTRAESSAHQPTLKSQISNMLRHTLDALAQGGIRDQLGGGFHRYSTDAHWLVPHFEIMLYDNAMLAWCYVESFRRTKEPRDAETARGVFDFVLREMTSPAGAFYTAMDAEVDGQEGLNYLWTAEEIESVLGTDDARIFNAVYGVDRGPNFADPHHGSGIADQNILFLPDSMIEAAKKLKLEPAALQSRLAPMRAALYQVRQKRKQPLLDTKVITSWNALMIRALAFGGMVLNEPRYTEAAAKAAEFLLRAHRTPDGGLFRTSRDGAAKYSGFLDDYAFLIQALLALADATGSAAWAQRAAEVSAVMTRKFSDDDAGGFFFTEAGATDLIIRQKAATDSPLPSGNAVAIMSLIEMGKASSARGALAEFAQQLESSGEGMSAMVQAAMLIVAKEGPFTVSAGVEPAAENPPPTADALAREIVSTRTEWKSPGELLVHLSIRRGYHINANPAADGQQATTLLVDDAAAVVEYPPAEVIRPAFAENQPIDVYSGEVTITVRFAAPRQSGSALRLGLVFQACDDASCLPPVTVGAGV